MSDGLAGGPDPECRVVRHLLADRIYHWVMAASVLILLGTSFLPIVGVKFPWLTAHWITGIVLTVVVLYHIFRALIWQDRGSMGLDRSDVTRSRQAVDWALRRRKTPPDRPGKYPLLQKLYHHGIALVILATIVTGLIMLAKIDTPFWTRNPYFLSSKSWGLVFVVHGLAALAVLSLVIVHIYFAVRPEKLWITRSMIRGWITRAEFETHHDPDLWTVSPPADREGTNSAEKTGGGDAETPG